MVATARQNPCTAYVIVLRTSRGLRRSATIPGGGGSAPWLVDMSLRRKITSGAHHFDHDARNESP